MTNTYKIWWLLISTYRTDLLDICIGSMWVFTRSTTKLLVRSGTFQNVCYKTKSKISINASPFYHPSISKTHQHLLSLIHPQTSHNNAWPVPSFSDNLQGIMTAESLHSRSSPIYCRFPLFTNNCFSNDCSFSQRTTSCSAKSAEEVFLQIVKSIKLLHICIGKIPDSSSRPGKWQVIV